MTRRSIRHAGVATAIAVLGGLAPVAVPVGASSQQTPQIELIQQSTWVRDTDIFSVVVAVEDAPVDATLELKVYSAVERRADFEETFEAGNLVGDSSDSDPQPLSTVGATASGQFTLSYPVGEEGAGLDSSDEAGVYPVAVRLADAGGEPLAHLVTYLLLLPDAAETVEPLSVGVLVDVGAAGPGLKPSGGTALTPTDESNLQDRVDLLNQTAPIPLTVAPVPETLDALGLNPEAEDLLSGLRQGVANREVLAGPFVDLDLDALSAANLLDQVTPERETGVRAVTQWLQPGAVTDVWATNAPVDESAALTLQTLGIPRAVVPSGSVERVIGHPRVGTPTAPVRLTRDGAFALVADDALRQRILGQEGVIDGQRFLAELALIWMQDPEVRRGIVVRIPDSEALDLTGVLHAIKGLAPEGVTAPLLRATTLGDLFSRPPLDGEEDPAVVELAQREEPPDNLAALPPAMARAGAIIDGLAGALDNTSLIDSLHRSLMIAPGYATPAEERMQYVRRLDRVSDDLAQSINAPAGFTITLTARDGNIPLAIDNNSDQTVIVEVQLTSSQLTFPKGTTQVMVLEPGQTTKNLPVRARASGAFPLDVTITSPNGQVVFDQATFTIRSTAISGVGLVLSIGAGLFLLIWWARHWRTTRRAKKLVPEHAAGRRRLVR